MRPFIRHFTVSSLLLLAFVPVSSLAVDEPVSLTVAGEPITGIARPTTVSEIDIVFGADGLYSRSGDGEWARSGDAPGTDAVVFDDSGSILLAGSTPPCLRGGDERELRRSVDGGATWIEIEGTAGYRPLAVFNDTGLALATSCRGLQASDDEGMTWSLAVELLDREITSSAVVDGDEKSEPTVLLGLTSEGGSSELRSVRIPEGGVLLSDPLQEYWGVGALAGQGDRFMLGASNGVRLSADRGKSWSETRDGLEAVTLEVDPLVNGLPEGVEANSFGLLSAALVAGDREIALTGSVDGLFVRAAAGEGWQRLPNISGEVSQIVVRINGGSALIRNGDEVYDVTFATAAGEYEAIGSPAEKSQ